MLGTRLPISTFPIGRRTEDKPKPMEPWNGSVLEIQDSKQPPAPSHAVLTSFSAQRTHGCCRVASWVIAMPGTELSVVPTWFRDYFTGITANFGWFCVFYFLSFESHVSKSWFQFRWSHSNDIYTSTSAATSAKFLLHPVGVAYRGTPCVRIHILHILAGLCRVLHISTAGTHVLLTGFCRDEKHHARNVWRVCINISQKKLD